MPRGRLQDVGGTETVTPCSLDLAVVPGTTANASGPPAGPSSTDGAGGLRVSPLLNSTGGPCASTPYLGLVTASSPVGIKINTDDAEMEMGDAENWHVDCRLDINDRAVFDSTPPRPAKLMPVRKTPTIAPTGSCVLLVADEETAISDIGSEGLYISEDEPVWDVGNAISAGTTIARSEQWGSDMISPFAMGLSHKLPSLDACMDLYKSLMDLQEPETMKYWFRHLFPTEIKMSGEKNATHL